MNNFTNPLDKIRIASPCPADWEKMIGDERKRFCGDCKLNVYNLSGMKKTEAENLLINSEGRLCVRFYRRADGTVLTQNCPVGWAKVKQRVSRITTAAFSLIAGMVGGIFAFNQLNFDTESLMKEVKEVEIEEKVTTKKLFPVVGEIPLQEIKKKSSKSKMKQSGWANGRVENIRRLEDEPVELWIQ